MEKRPSPKNQRQRKVKIYQKRTVQLSKVSNSEDVVTFPVKIADDKWRHICVLVL